MVSIKWFDAITDIEEYKNIEEIRKELHPLIASTVGFLIDDSDDNYMVAHLIWKNKEGGVDGYKYISLIPHKLVVEFKELKAVE